MISFLLLEILYQTIYTKGLKSFLFWDHLMSRQENPLDLNSINYQPIYYFLFLPIIQLKKIIERYFYMSSQPQQTPKTAQTRDYGCPCGKAYLSYPALFTHIKQKHDGKAPGQIRKPKPSGRGRGRPPKQTQQHSKKKKEGLTSRQTSISLPVLSEENLTYRIQFEKIFHHLHTMHYPQEIASRIWDQVNSFRRFQEYIDGSHKKLTDSKNFVNIGFGLSQFLKDVSINTQAWRFEQVLVLFMLLLQYVQDESNDPLIIQNSPVDSLVQFMNPFIDSHIGDYAQFLGINNLWVMKEQNIHYLFMCFYNWLKWRSYTSFCITLID